MINYEITQRENEEFKKTITNDEIRNANFSIWKDKFPRLDDFLAGFYQKY